MKILYHHRVGSKDGQLVHIEEIVRALRALGHEVVVIGPAAMKNTDFGADSGLVRRLKDHLPPSLYELLELAYGAMAFVRLWLAYRHERPDIIYERYNLYLLAGAWLKRLTGVPLLLEVNAPLVAERSQFDQLTNKRIAQWAERSAWRSASYVLPVTRVLAGEIGRAGVDAQRVVVIQNGVGTEFLQGTGNGARVKKKFDLEDCLVLGFTGFIREWHRLERVVDFIAREKTDRVRALFVGTGPAVAELQQHAAVQGVADRVIFAGLIPREEIVDYVAAFDVALQPHVVPYASPLKLFEYMALGRAIVAPATANIREVLSNGEDALLFDPDDASAFGAALEQLCDDAALRERLGRAARATLERKGFTWADNARRIVALGEEALAARRNPQLANPKAAK
jgi:glycosyltransferase involved in cell wall biosynthesis